MLVCNAIAAVTSCSSTSMGSAARRAGQSMPWNPAPAPEQTNRGHTAGWASEALATRPPTAAAMATWVDTSTFLLSVASARVPPHSAPASSGKSWARPINPTTRVEWVRA